MATRTSSFVIHSGDAPSEKLATFFYHPRIDATYMERALGVS